MFLETIPLRNFLAYKMYKQEISLHIEQTIFYPLTLLIPSTQLLGVLVSLLMLYP